MKLDPALAARDASAGKPSLLDRLFPVNQGLAIKSMFGIWGAYFLFVTSRFLYMTQNNPDALFFQRILMTSVCITFTWLLSAC